MRVIRILSCSFLLASCVGPQVSDELAPSGAILPAGSEVPDGHADPSVESAIAANDNVEGEIARLSAFAGGERVWYWDFGPAQPVLAPVFVLVKDGDPIGHPAIVTCIPGTKGYSPFWRMVTVEVTDDYDGELITSSAGLADAERLGLVETPEAQDVTINCPIVASDVTLEVGGGQPALEPPSRFYWNGVSIRYFDLGEMAFDGLIAPESLLLRLAREGQAPLSEPVRGVDMTGDGDIVDTNDILTAQSSEEGYFPACRQIDVQVPQSYASIDTASDETVADFRSTDDLFDPDPVAGNVVAFSDRAEIRNCAVQRESGGL